MSARSAKRERKNASTAASKCYVVPPSARGWVHAYSVTATSMLNRRKAILDYLQGAVWVLPTFGVAIGLGSGAVLSMIPVKSGTLIDKLMFQGTPGDARGVLIVVSATMITTIGIVFSLTVLSLQIASSQFSVRLLRTFLRDVPNQVVLAIFACTFAYSTGGLHTVGEHRDGGAFIPKVAVTGSLALAFVSIAALIYFLHHLMHSIQIDTIMDKVRLRTLGLVDQLYPESDTADRQVETPPSPPADAVPLLAPHSGYLQTVDVDDIAELAAASRYTALLVTFVGDYVTAGGLLGWCWRRGTAPGAPGSDFPQRCLRHVHIGFERTLQQDIRFGLRQMVDIALRHYRPHSTTRTRRSKSCTIFRPWSRCWHRGRCRTTCAATAPGSSSSGCRTPASPPTCTSDVPRSAATARVSRWCSLRCCSCSARSPRTASTRRAV